MANLQKKTIQTKRSLTYTYYVRDGDSTKPTLFFLHGFPDSAHMWSDVVDNLSDLPCRVIIPDCLGYGGTSKPTDIAAYKTNGHSADFFDILSAENVEKVVVIGHDIGAMLAQRFYNYYPGACAGVFLCNVSYIAPSKEKFDLEKNNALTQKQFGYPLYEYWNVFTSAEGYKTLNNNLERFWEVLHGDEEDWMKKMFNTKDGITSYMSGDKRVDLKPFAKLPKWKDDFMQRFSRDGFEGPTNYYKSIASNYQWEADKDIPEEDYIVKVPFFFMGCTGDSVCRTDLIHGPHEAGLLPDFDMTEIESGHWCAMEEPEKVAQAIRGFVTKRFL